MSKHDQTHVEAGFFNTHSQQLHELCGCLKDKHIFQKSEIALAIVSALMCNSALYSSVRAEDFPSVLEGAGFAPVDLDPTLEGYIGGTLAAKGPYSFSYKDDPSKRVGYVNVFVSGNKGDGSVSNLNPITNNLTFVMNNALPQDLFVKNGNYPTYLSLIGAYWAGAPQADNLNNFNYALDVFKGKTLDVTFNAPPVSSGQTLPPAYWVNDIFAANQDKVNNVHANLFHKDFTFTTPIDQEYLANNGPLSSEDWYHLLSTVQENTLKVTLSEGATVNFQRLVGGKTRTWRETGSNGTKPWTYAYHNSVVINGNGGTLIGKSTYDLDDSAFNPSNDKDIDGNKWPLGVNPKYNKYDFLFYYRSSIIGGYGFLANNNSVSIKDAIIKNISKKYGIIGGRAYDGVNLTKNTLYGCSANFNSIYIADSEVGIGDTDGGINIYAALSYGTATNNLSALERSHFQGNVYGAAAALGSVLDRNRGRTPNEAVTTADFYKTGPSVTTINPDSLTNEQILYLFNKAKNQTEENSADNTNRYFDNNDINPNKINAAFESKWSGLDDTNSISLNDVSLTEGSSVYASAGILAKNVGNDTFARFNNAQVVNLRRGTAYIAGINKVSSIYAKNVIFGQYQTEDQNGTFKTNNDKTLRLGENISSSYVINTSGFHSSLSPRTKGQADITAGMHNFWSNVTAVLGDSMNGDGRDLTVNNNVFNSSGNIEKREFSLLALDNNDATGDRYFANSAKLYFAVSNGGSNKSAPIAINWTKIAKYRLSFASGGQFSPDGELVKSSDPKTILPIFAKSYSPFPIVNIVVGKNTFRPDEKDRLIITESTLSEESFGQYIQKLQNTSFVSEITVNQSDSLFPEGRKAATAIFDIGQYLDFGEIYKTKVGIELPINGTLEEFAKAGDYISYVSPSSTSNWEGGIGVRYKLKELRLSGPLQLILYGQKLDALSDGQSEEGYTLDARLTQDTGVEGGIIVYQGQKVIIQTQYNEDLVNNYIDKFSESINHQNEFSGPTSVQVGSVLDLEGNDALGTKDIHTSSLFLRDNSQFNLRGYKQIIGSLNEDNAAMNLAGTVGSGTLNIQHAPEIGSYIRGTISGQNASVISVVNGTTSIKSPNGTGYVGNFNVLSGTTKENSQPISGGKPILLTTVYLASPLALEKATINAQDGTSLVFDNGSTDEKPVTVVPGENGAGNYHAGTINAGAGYLFVSNPNIQVQNVGIVPHHLHVNSMNLKGTNLVFSTQFQKDPSGFVDNSPTDRIYVDGVASGSGNVLINALPGSEMGYTKTNGGILLVSAPNADQNFKLSKGQVYIVQENMLSRAADNNSDIKYELRSKNNPNGSFEDGAYKYWYLVSSVDGQSPDDKDHPTPSDPNKPVDEPTQPGDTTPSKDPGGSFTPGGTRPGHHETQVRPQLAAFATNVLAWDKLNMRLHDRIGEAYFLDPETHEVKKAAGWARFQGTHGHAKVDRSARTTGNYMTTQVGADLLRTDLNEDWRLIGGVFFGNVYGRAHTNSLLKARSKVVGFGGGAYLTLFSGNSPDDGFYTDLWVSYNHFKNEVSGDEPSVKYHSKGMNYSGEIGYTIHAATTGSSSSQDKVDWYIQPQFQATLQGVKADNFTDWTGNRIKQEGKYNVQLRTGVRVYGRQSAQGNVFVEANWIHNTKKQGVISGAETYYVDGTRNAGEGRIGWEGNITKNLLGSVTGSVRAGNKGYNEVSGNISIKYMF